MRIDVAIWAIEFTAEQFAQGLILSTGISRELPDPLFIPK
jgi:hypothetical protein